MLRLPGRDHGRCMGGRPGSPVVLAALPVHRPGRTTSARRFPTDVRTLGPAGGHFGGPHGVNGRGCLAPSRFAEFAPVSSKISTASHGRVPAQGDVSVTRADLADRLGDLCNGLKARDAVLGPALCAGPGTAKMIGRLVTAPLTFCLANVSASEMRFTTGRGLWRALRLGGIALCYIT